MEEQEVSTSGAYSFINQNTAEWEDCGFLNKDGAEAEPGQDDEDEDEGEEEDAITTAEVLREAKEDLGPELMDTSVSADKVPNVVKPVKTKIVKTAGAVRAEPPLNDVPSSHILPANAGAAKPKQLSGTQVVVLPEFFDFSENEDDEAFGEEEDMEEEVAAPPVEVFDPKYVEKTVVCLDHPTIAHGRIQAPQALTFCKLMKDGMVGKLVLYAEMSASRVQEEIRTAFAECFNGEAFTFKYLQPLPGHRWLAVVNEENLTGKEVLAMSGMGRIYIATYFNWSGVERPLDKKQENTEKKDAYGFINQSTTELEQQGVLRVKEELVDVGDTASNNLPAATPAIELQQKKNQETVAERAQETVDDALDDDDEETRSATEVPGLMRETIKLDETGKIQHVEFVIDNNRQPVIKLERLDDQVAMPPSPASTSSYGSSNMDAEEIRKEQERDLLTEDKLQEVKERVEKNMALEEATMVGRQSSRASAIKARTSIAVMNELSLIGDEVRAGVVKADGRRKRPLDADDPEVVPAGGKMARRTPRNKRGRPKKKHLYEEMSEEEDVDYDYDAEEEENNATEGENEDLPLDTKRKAVKIREYKEPDAKQSSGIKKTTMMTANCDLLDETSAVKRIRRRMFLRGAPSEDIGDKRYASHIKCKFCGDHQRTLLHLYQHLSVTHPYNNARFECQECGALHTNATDMEEHMKVHCMRYAEVVYQVKRHGDGKFEYHCPVVSCTANPMNWSKMINHLHYHRSKDCLLCGERIFPNPMKTFCTHVSTHIEGGPYVCPFCPKVFFNEMEDFRNHLMTSHGGDPNKKWVCRFCYKVFESFSEFDLHLLGWHSNRPYCCQYCGQEFSSVITLEGHMERHDRGRQHDQLYSTCFKSFKGDKTVAKSPSSSVSSPSKNVLVVNPSKPDVTSQVVKQLLNDKRQQIQVIRKDGSVQMIRTLEEVQTMAAKSTALSQSRSVGIPRILKRQVVNVGAGSGTDKVAGTALRPIAPVPQQVQIPLPTGMSLPIGSKHQIFVLRPALPGTPGVAPGSMQLLPLNAAPHTQPPMTSLLKTNAIQHLKEALKIEPGNQVASVPSENSGMALKITDIRGGESGGSGDAENHTAKDEMENAGSDNDEASPIVIEPIQDKPAADGGSVRDSKGATPSGDLKVCFHKHCFQVSQSAIDLWINHYFPKHFKREDNLEFMCCQCAALYANYDWPPMNHSCKKPTFIHVCTDCGLLFQMLREKVQHFQQCKFFVTEQSLLRAGTPMDLLTCQYCLEVHPNIAALCDHLLNAHQSVRFGANVVCCEQCPVIRRFLDVKHLWEHNKMSHSEWWRHCGRWLCSYCGIDHTTEQEFNEHVIYSHAAYSPPHHFCSVCMEIFATRLEYNYHSVDCSEKRKEEMRTFESTPVKQATVIAPLEDTPPENQQRKLVQPEMLFNADPTPLVITPDGEDESDDDQEVYIQVIQPEESASPVTTTTEVPDTDQPMSEPPLEADDNCSSGVTSDTREVITPLDIQPKEEKDVKAAESDQSKDINNEISVQNSGTTEAMLDQEPQAISRVDQNGGPQLEKSSNLSLSISDVRTCPADPGLVKRESYEPGMLEEERSLKCQKCPELFVDFESLRDHARLTHKPTPKLLMCPCAEQPPSSMMKWPHKYWQHVISYHIAWFQTFKAACTVCGELFENHDQFHHHQIYQHNHDVKSITIQECIEMVCKMHRASKGYPDIKVHKESSTEQPMITTAQPITTQSAVTTTAIQSESAIMISSSDEEEGPATLSNKFNFTMLKDIDSSVPKTVTADTSELDHVCVDCGKHLPDLIALRRHQRAEHPMGLIKCEKCKQRIEVAKIKDHVCGDNEADVVSVFPCEFCNERFAYLAAKNRHIAAKHRNQLKRCIACGKAFVTQDTLDKHTERMHPAVFKTIQAKSLEATKPKVTTIIRKPTNTTPTNLSNAAVGGACTKVIRIKSATPQYTRPLQPIITTPVKSPLAGKQVLFSKAKREQNWIMKNTMHQMYAQKCRFCSKLIVNWSENNRHESFCKKNPIFQEKKNLRALLSERRARLGPPGSDYSEDESDKEQEVTDTKNNEGSQGGRIIALRHNVSSSDEEPAAEVVFTDNPEGNICKLPPRQTKSPEDQQQEEDVFDGAVEEAQRRARDEEVFGPAKSTNNVLVDKVFQQEADEKKKMLQEEERRAREQEVFGLPQTVTSALVEEVFGPSQSLNNSPAIENVFEPSKSVAVDEAVIGPSHLEPSSTTGSDSDIGVQPMSSNFDRNTRQPLDIFPVGEPILNCSQSMGNVLEICPIAEDTVPPIVIGEGLRRESDGGNVMITPTASGDQNNESNIDELLVPSATQTGKPLNMDLTSEVVLEDNFNMGQLQDKQGNKNTVRATNRDIKQFQDFLKTLMVVDPIEKLSPKDMNAYLAKYFMTAVKKNGLSYEPHSLTAKLYSIDRYLTATQYRYSLRHDPLFKQARESLKAKKVQSKEEGRGNRPKKATWLSEEDEALLRKARVFGADSPFSLQFSIWYTIMMTTGLWGRKEHKKLTWQDLTMKVDNNGREYLDMVNCMAKTKESTNDSNVLNTPSRYYCVCLKESDECLIGWLQIFFSKRPRECFTPGHPLYLTPIPVAHLKSTGTPWYYHTPMGVNRIGSLLSDACKMAGIENRTNCDNRKAAIERWRKAVVVDNKITDDIPVHTLDIFNIRLTDKEHVTPQAVISSQQPLPVHTSLTLRPQLMDPTRSPISETMEANSGVSEDDCKNEQLETTIKKWDEDVKKFINENKKPEKENTIRVTKRDVGQFMDFLEAHGVEVPIVDLSPHDMNMHLTKYFMESVKKDGSTYEPISLKAKFYSIDRYLVSMGYGYSLRSDLQFKLVRDSLSVKRVQSMEEEESKCNEPSKAGGLSTEDDSVTPSIETPSTEEIAVTDTLGRFREIEAGSMDPNDDLDMEHLEKDSAEKWDDDMKNSFYKKFVKTNTIRATNRDVKQFQDFLATLMVVAPIEKLSPHDLNKFLAKYFITAIKKDGSTYEPASLTAKLYSIDRYLTSADYTHSLRSDPEFKLARDSLKAKKFQSKEEGKGNRPHKRATLTEEDEAKLRKAGVLGASTPFSLQFSIWYILTMTLGIWGREQHRKLTWDDLTIKVDDNQKEYLDMSNFMAKPKKGSNVQKKLYRYDCVCDRQSKECLIEWLKKFFSKRPVCSCVPGYPLYLTPVPSGQHHSTDLAWYYASPMGINKIGCILPDACTMAGIERIDNRGVRKAARKMMRKAKMLESKVDSITEHKLDDAWNSSDSELSNDESFSDSTD